MDERETNGTLTGGEEQNLGISADLIRGHISTIILRCLYEEDKYGYDIIGEIERKSGGLYTIKQPTLYSALKRLEADKYVESYYGEQSNGGRRKYFRLSNAGREFTQKSLADWEYSRTIIDSLISDGEAHFDFSFITEKQTELADLKKSLASREQALEDEKIALNNLRNELQRERALLATQSSSLNTQKNDYKELREKLDEQAIELENQHNALREKELLLTAKEEELRLKEEQILQMRTDLEVQTSQIAKLQSALQTQQDAYNAQAEALRSAQSQANTLQLENEALKAHAQALETMPVNSEELEALRAQLSTTKKELEDTYVIVEYLRSAVSRQESTIDSLKSNLNDKAESYTAMDLELQAKQAQFNAQKQQLDEEKQRVEELHTACQRLQAELEEKERIFTQSMQTERAELFQQSEALETEKQQLVAEKQRLEDLEQSLQLRREEIDKKAYELAQTETRLDEQQRTIYDRVAVTENKDESLQLRQEDLENLELELMQEKQKLQEEMQNLQQQERDLASRITIYNQQQLDFITRKNALSAQEYDLADKISAYNTQNQLLQDAKAQLEADKEAFALEQNLFEARIRALDEEKAILESNKQAFANQQAEAERTHDMLRRQIQEERLQMEQTMEPAQSQTAEPLPVSSVSPIPQPVTVQAPTPVPPVQENFYNNVHARAQEEGIKIHTAGFAGTPPSSPTPYPADGQARGYYNAGQTLFKSAMIVFCIILFESLLVFFMKDYLGVSFVYPVVGFAGGFILFIICAIMFACGFKPIARRKKHASYIFTMSILFVIAIIAITMVAVYCKAPIAKPAKLLAFVVIPVVYFLNMVFFAIFYRLFSLKNITVSK